MMMNLLMLKLTITEIATIFLIGKQTLKMIYDPKNPIDAQRARKRFESLMKLGKVFTINELTSKSVSQNNYLHLLIGFVAIELGENADYIKEHLYKRNANRDLFVFQKHDRHLDVDVECVKSTADITKEELSASIDRFRNYMSSVFDIYLPEPNEEEFLNSIKIEIERNRYFSKNGETYNN